MSVEDPGWEGYSPFGQEPPAASPAQPPAPAATPPPPEGEASGYDEATGYDEPVAATPPISPAAASGYSPPPALSGGGKSGGSRGGPPRNVLIGAGALLLVVVIVIVAVVVSGGKKKQVAVITPVAHRTAVTAPTAGASTGSAATTAASSAPAAPTPGPSVTSSAAPATSDATTGDTSAALLSVVPDGFTGTCQAEPKADWLSSTTVDEMVCLTQSVPDASAVLVGVARQKAAANVTDTFDNILKLNGFKANTGACAAGNLVGTTATGSYCESAYSNSDGTTGRELLYDGSRVNVGGASGETSTFCQEAFPGSSGVSFLAYTDSGEHNVVIALNCNPAANLLSGLQAALNNGVYDLTD